jgi:hypothetical protein
VARQGRYLLADQDAEQSNQRQDGGRWRPNIEYAVESADKNADRERD